jgi:parallel beta-helix repeat protein
MVSTGCGGDGTTGRSALADDDPAVLRVGPERRFGTVQGAVDAARPGDLVLVDAGTYREAVVIETDRLVVRGADRNAVVLDGAGRLPNGIEVRSDQVAVENLTVRDYTVNGVLFSGPYGSDIPQDGPVGWRASYVTAVGNGLYGLYAFGTGPGQFDHNYASGHPDAGIYVGQCDPCGAVVVDNVVEHNAVGYENTNASDVVVAGNVVRGNRVGIAMSSEDAEALAPQRGGKVIGNLIVDNDDPATPETRGGFGVGIVVAGGTGNEVRGNRVTGHSGAGIVLVDQDGYAPAGNEVADNEVTGNGVDLLLASADGTAPEASGTCFAGNAGATSRPFGLQGLLACGRPAGTLPAGGLDLPEGPDGLQPDEVVTPPEQPGLPGAGRLRWSAPPLRPDPPDLDTVVVPAP